MSSSPRGARRRRPVLVPVAAALAGVGVGVTAAFGGFKQAAEEPPPKYAAGDTVDQVEFLTEFVKAADLTEKGDFGNDKRFLQMTFTVTNQGKETATVGLPPEPGKNKGVGWASSLLSITPGPPDKKANIFTFVRDHGVQSSQLQPGVPHTVIVRWELPATATAPSAVTLNVGTFEFTQASHAVAGHFWSLVPGSDEKPATAATVTLDVKREQA